MYVVIVAILYVPSLCNIFQEQDLNMYVVYYRVCHSNATVILITSFVLMMDE